MAGGLEQGSWGLGRVSKGLGGWGLERAEGLGSGGGLDPQGTSGRTFGRSFVRTFGRTDGKFTPLSYRTSSPSGPLPKNRAYLAILMGFIDFLPLVVVFKTTTTTNINASLYKKNGAHKIH